MHIGSIQPTTRNKKKKIIGRGGKRGTYSGRGIKGQKARAGHKIRPEMRDIIKKLPKLRGYAAPNITHPSEKAIIHLDTLEKHFGAGQVITPKLLFEKGIVSRVGGKAPKIKILSRGALTKSLLITGMAISRSAKDALIKAGGNVT